MSAPRRGLRESVNHEMRPRCSVLRSPPLPRQPPSREQMSPAGAGARTQLPSTSSAGASAEPPPGLPGPPGPLSCRLGIVCAGGRLHSRSSGYSAQLRTCTPASGVGKAPRTSTSSFVSSPPFGHMRGGLHRVLRAPHSAIGTLPSQNALGQPSCLLLHINL